MSLFRLAGLVALCLLLGQFLAAAQSTGKRDSQNGKSVQNGAYHSAYHSATFGFSYRVPFGWVERTAEMQQGPADPATGHVLLAVFERPPEATGETINSAVTVAKESISSYPGLKTAADYFGPIDELADKMELKAVSQPYEVTIGGKRLVRGDYKKDVGKLTMYWSSLVMLAHGQIVSFTFVASSDDEINQLIDRLSFAPVRR